ncbi:MAG TPA: COX15/CtaA family protein [Candidatus Dormibacteraeota bacterium]|nr:COX15/CtaA family protein [Candidatus Dormibacteraeota bacterium]
MRPSQLGKRAVFTLGIATAVGMFLVLVMGATVTSTGSATGCGRDWPLCQGRFIPQFAVATAIEFSHRAVTGVESLLVVAFAAGLLWLHRGQRPARALAALMVGFLALQAGMGAWAVVQPQDPLVLALHFGISLIALASTALAAAYTGRAEEIRNASPVPGGLRVATWGFLVYVYLLVYSGASIRHLGIGPACPGWPLCSGTGTATPEALAINLAHRSAAGLAVVLAAALLAAYVRLGGHRRDLVTAGALLVTALLAQGAAGAYLVLSRWDLFGELLHAAMTGVVFTTAAYLCMRVALQAPAGAASVVGERGLGRPGRFEAPAQGR